MAKGKIKDFISDEEMASLDKSSEPPDFIPDEDVAKLAAVPAETPAQAIDRMYGDDGSMLSPKSVIGGLLAPVAYAGEGLLKGAAYVGEKIDPYAGAPVRRALGAYQSGKGALESLQLGASQFGEPTTTTLKGREIPLVPSWKDLAANAGLPETTLSEYGVPIDPDSPFNVSPAGVGGFAAGMALDPTPLYLGAAGKALKGAGGLLKGASEIKGTMAAGDAISPTRGMIAQMEQKLKAAGKADQPLPSAARLDEIKQILPDMEFGPTEYHYKKLSSPSNRDALATKYENLASREKDTILRHDQAMKSEIAQKVIGEAERLSPGGLAPDAAKAGEEIMSSIDDVYQQNKKQIAPLFENLKSLEIPKPTHVDSLVKDIAQEAPKLERVLSLSEDGTVALAPFSPKLGLSRKEYSGVKEIMKDINSGSLSFDDMQKMREYLRKQVDPINPKESEVLDGIRKGMLSHMQKMVEEYHPDQNVRGVFQQWAKNEKYLEGMQKLLGGKVGQTFDEALKASPEDVINRVFKNTKSLKTAQQYLSPEQINSMLGNKINQIFNESFDSAKNTFRSAEFAKKVKALGPVLSLVSPQTKMRLEAMADLAKIVPDAMPVNPSGTAKTLMGLLKESAKNPGSAPERTLEFIGDKVKGKRSLKEFEDFLGGTETKSSLAKKMTEKSKKAGKGLLKGAPRGLQGASVYSSQKER